MTKDEQIRRMHGVERVTQDPLFLEAWDTLRDRLMHLMVNAQSDEATLKAKTMLQLLGDLQTHWARIISDGKLAAEEIRLEEERKRIRWPKWA